MAEDVYKRLEAQLKALLDMEYGACAVELIQTQEEYEALSAPEPKAPLNYCQMVKAALSGHALKASRAEHFRCLAGPSTIGVLPYPKESSTGEQLSNMGMYHDLLVARNIAKNMAHCPQWAYGVLVQPLSQCTRPPHVIVLVTNPFNAMRIVQGYSYQYGTNTSFQMTGNQAFCSECTAYPIEHGRMNMSMLCSGTRNRVQWREDELAIGIPFFQLETLLGGIRATVNPMELDGKKKRIEGQYAAMHEDTDWIRFGWNYWSDLTQRQQKMYKNIL